MIGFGEQRDVEGSDLRTAAALQRKVRNELVAVGLAGVGHGPCSGGGQCRTWGDAAVDFKMRLAVLQNERVAIDEPAYSAAA